MRLQTPMEGEKLRWIEQQIKQRAWKALNQCNPKFLSQLTDQPTTAQIRRVASTVKCKGITVRMSILSVKRIEPKAFTKFVAQQFHRVHDLRRSRAWFVIGHDFKKTDGTNIKASATREGNRGRCGLFRGAKGSRKCSCCFFGNL